MRNLSNRELVDMACSATIPPKALFEVRQEPQRKSEDGKISDAQRKRFYAIAKTTGFSDDEIKAHLASLGIEHTADILKSQYDELCTWALIGEHMSSSERNANKLGKSAYLLALETELLRRLEAGDRAIKACREIAADCNKILENK